MDDPIKEFKCKLKFLAKFAMLCEETSMYSKIELCINL